ncbi:MAG: beta-lactamase family protein [Parvularculaceae bacterium]|nr:beta-lactamase family protein [Parvularculaceae bacterium]
MSGRMLAAAIAASVCVFSGAAIAQRAPVQGDLAPHAGRAARATLSDLSSIESFLDGYAAAAMADRYPPAMMVAVASPDDIFLKAYGTADMGTGARATPETLFRIASISKTFVWTAVMMLVDEGRLDLDADVNLYLKTLEVKARYGAPVTLNDLMAHRPGFEDTLGDFFQNGKGRTIEEALRKTAPARVAPPGERTSYSNWGTDLAAQIVADVSGEPYDEFVRVRILDRIGMTSTILHDPVSIADTPLNDPALDARLAAPHKLDGGAPAPMTHDALDPLHAAGAVAFDAHDAARWLQFLLNDGVADGDRLLSPQAFTMMRLRAFPDRTGAPDFAHGFMETEIAGQRAFGHGGSLSGFISDMTISPALGLGVFVVVNGAEAPRLPDLVSRAIIEQFAGSSDQWPSPWRVEADAAMVEKAKSLAGVYRPNRFVHSRLERIAAAGAELRIAAKEDGSLVVVAGGQRKRYYPLAEDLWTDRSVDRLFAYRDANGTVKRISYALGTDTAEPVSFLQSTDGLNAALGAVSFFSVLAFIGAWRRQGRSVRTTPVGRWLAAGHLLGALVWLVALGVLVWVTADLTGKELPDLQAAGWPPPSVTALQIAAHAAALAAILGVIGLVPVAARSGWSLWRKAHYALFAAAGLFGLYELALWRLILAAPSG